jgi:hypothetical protein
MANMRLIVACFCLLVALAACSSSGQSAERNAQVASMMGGAGGASAGTNGMGQGGAAGSVAPTDGGGVVDVGPTGDACASAEVATTRVIPTVWLLVDGSGSMAAQLGGLAGGPSRWTALRDSLLADPGGLVAQLQSSVSFGLLVYDGGNSLPGMAGPQCPRVVAVPPMLDNFSAISTQYPAMQTGASTPTHYALLDLQKRIDANPSTVGPTYVVLATDGAPNLCDFHDGVPSTPATEQEAVATVKQLADAGIQSFVISMAGDDAALKAHLDAVAVAGGTGTPVFTPTTQNDLASALTQIIGATASCDVKLEGHVEAGLECSGTVKLEDQALICNDPNGYRLKADRQTLELTGDACTQLQAAANGTLKAAFPCGVVTPD